MNARWLVPHDFSSFGEAALNEAVLDMKSHGNGKIFLLHAVMLPLPAGIAFPEGVAGAVSSQVDLRRRALLAAEDGLKNEQVRVKQEHDMDVETLALEGDPMECIFRAAKDNECNRIIMGSHGRRGLDRYLLGSVAEKIVRRSEIPVLVVKTPRE
ncbi:MAG: universal stress protein [Deltaproteobacteria bacterium]|nr:universal stress protein [Deltaproteobacteria bacterium]